MDPRIFFSTHRPYAPIDLSIYTMRISLLSPLLLLVAVLTVGCGRSGDTPGSNRTDSTTATTGPKLSPADSARRADSVKVASAPATTFPEIRYRKVHIGTRTLLDSILKAFPRNAAKDTSDPSAARILATINRKEYGSIRVGDSVVLPDSLVRDTRAYSVFPATYPGAASLPKIIMLSNALQSYACYEYGKLIRFVGVNTGRESKATYPGRYACNWKDRLRKSSLNEFWILPYTVNFHYHAGNAFHQFYMPGRPVSHSCVRQMMTDAKWLFDWVEVGQKDANGKVIEFTGTPVIILDMFDFARPRFGPWLDLKSNHDGILQLPPKPMEVEEALIPSSQVPGGAHQGLPHRERYVYAEDTLRARGIIRPQIRLSPSINYNKLRKAKQAAAARKAKKPTAAPPAGQ